MQSPQVLKLCRGRSTGLSRFDALYGVTERERAECNGYSCPRAHEVFQILNVDLRECANDGIDCCRDSRNIDRGGLLPSTFVLRQKTFREKRRDDRCIRAYRPALISAVDL